MTLRTTAAAAGILLATTLARADGPATRPTDDCLPYRLWAKFKPGSSATLTGDLNVPGLKMVAHVEMTVTLRTVTPDAVTVETVQKTTGAGQTQVGAPQTQSIAAKMNVTTHEGGTADVTAIGRTFPCTIYETPIPGPAGSGAVRLYSNPDVPGGTVRVEIPTAGSAKPSTMTLTAMVAK